MCLLCRLPQDRALLRYHCTRPGRHLAPRASTCGPNPTHSNTLGADMRIVLFSDIHGNVVALEAILAEIRRAAAPDALFVAGDLVLLGPRPAEALALLRSLDGARFVKGNTDQYLIDFADDEQEVAFARRELSEEQIAFVRALPFEQRLEVAPGHELLVV